MASDKIKVSYLKSKLDDNRLDLSLSELSTVPVKEITELKKVTQLDLSRNRLEYLPKDFCSLTNLVELDLSSNHLRALPEKFGNFLVLQRLDLYRNSISDLPVSFCKLKQLRWLDMKDNPLGESLRSVAGDFSSEKECKQAATKVVQYMVKVQADHERERQKKLTAEREVESAIRVKEEEERKLAQQEKKKHKEDAKKKASESTINKSKDSDNGGKTKKEEMKSFKGRFDKESRKSEKKSSHLFSSLLKFLFNLIICLVIATAFTTLIVMFNCSSSYGGKFLPHSEELCNDFYYFATTGRVRLTWDYKDSLKLVGNGFSNGLNVIVYEIKHFDFENWKNWFINMLADLQTKVSPILQLSKECLEDAFNWTVHFTKIWATVTYQALLIIAENVSQMTIQTFNWILVNGRDLVDNYPKYWQQLKIYWHNMK